MPRHAIQGGHMGRTRIGQEGEGVEGEMWKSPYCGFLRKELVKQGKQVSDWLS